MGKPVDYDPFAAPTEAPAPTAAGGQAVDYDPFAAPAPKREPTFREQTAYPGGTMAEMGEFAKGMSLPLAGALQTIPYEPLQRKTAEYVSRVEKEPEFVRPGGTVGPRTLGKGLMTGALGTIPIGKTFEFTAGLTGLPKLLTRTAGGATAGGLTGSVMETAPTVEEIYPRKEEAGKTGAITGAIVTPALSGLGSLTKGAYNLVMKAKGRPVEEALASLKGMVTKEAEEARNFLTQKSAEAQRPLQSEVAAARDVTEARYGVRGKLTQDLNAAKRETEQTLTSLGPKESDEGFGRFVQVQGKRNIKSIRGTTEREAIEELKDPAFAEARRRAAQGDTLSTNPNSAPILQQAINDIEQQIKDVPAGFRGPLEDRLESIIGKKIPLSAEQLRVENLRAASIPGYVAKTFEREPLTLHQAEFLRRWAKDPILRKDTGFGALDATRMAKTGNRIEEAMNAYDSRIGQYIERYKVGKQAERVAVGRKKGEGPLEEAVRTEDEIIFAGKPQQVTSFYLDGTREAANKLIRIVGGKSPELVNRVKANVRDKVEGMDAAKTQQFIQKNEGMLQAFPEVRDSLNTLLKARQTQERLTSMVGKTQERLGKALGAEVTSAERLAAEAAKGQKAVAPYQQFMERFEGARGDEIFSESKKIVEKLRSDNVLDAPRYQQLLSEIRDIEGKYGATQEAKARLKNVLYITLVGGVGGLAGGYGGYKMYRGAKDIFGLGGQ